MYISYTYFRR